MPSLKPWTTAAMLDATTTTFFLASLFLIGDWDAATTIRAMNVDPSFRNALLPVAAGGLGNLVLTTLLLLKPVRTTWNGAALTLVGQTLMLCFCSYYFEPYIALVSMVAAWFAFAHLRELRSEGKRRASCD